MKKQNAPLMPNEAADVNEFLRLMEKEQHSLLTESERKFLKQWNSTHVFHMTRNEKGQLIYANEEQFEAAQVANEKGRIARNEYAARLKDAPHAQLGKKIKAGRSKGLKITQANSKEKAVQFRNEFKRVAKDSSCQKWSKDAQVDEAIKRLKKQKIRLGKSTAYAYLKPKK